MALRGGVQRRDLPGQIVVPRPGAELVNAHRHTHRRRTRSTSGQPAGGMYRRCKEVCQIADPEIRLGYVKQVDTAVMTARVVGSGLRPSKRPVSMREIDESHAMRQAARRSALDAQAILRKERADRERRLQGVAVAVLTALGERGAAVRDAERRAGGLQIMTRGGPVGP
jgi:hypothetical protein